MIYALRDRGRALEEKFAHEQTLNFQAEARRTRLIGLWAAACLGRGDGEQYAADLVRLVLDGASSSDIAMKLRHDFDLSDVALAEPELRHRMQSLLMQAERDLEAA